MPTPLCDALRAFAARDGLRMHMPGHKGMDMALSELSAAAPIDFTELPPTGDLFAGGGPIGAAEELWARQAGMERCLFLTGGSTQGLHAALALTCRPGERVLLDRGSHRAVYNAAALLDLDPVYLERPWLERAGLWGGVTPDAVAGALERHPEIKTVCITSPTYYGVLSDLPAIARVIHRRGGRLVVDGAHGAHLIFLEQRAALNQADVLVVSAHKTLSAPGQAAVLLTNGFNQDEVRRAGALFGSSSPSYLLMAGLDAAREDMQREGTARCRSAAEQVAVLRERFPAVTERDAPLDPLRLTLLARDGRRAEQALQEHNVWPEMADARHVVCILTRADGEASFARLTHALDALTDCWGKPEEGKRLIPPEPERVLSLRKALFSRREILPLMAAGGRVSACQLAPYPPGIPVVAPGERITKKALAYLAEVGYNMEQEIAVTADRRPL